VIIGNIKEGFVSFLQEIIEFLKNYENNENIRIKHCSYQVFFNTILQGYHYTHI
jgi:hypothetical protein